MKLCKLKCDRCGVEYEEKEDHKLIKIRLMKKLEDNEFYTDFSYNGTDLDLCKSCRDSFKNWWHM